jgi:EmrB/QacA subfamily drug resistance transporter
MGSAAGLAIPWIGADLGMDAITLGWVATSFLLAAAVVLPPIGRLADTYGRVRLFGAGAFLYTVSSGLCGIATGAPFLIAARAAQGIGSSFMFGTGLAMLSAVFPPGERGRVFGLNVAAVYVGLSLGPPVGGLLVGVWGWRSIFLAQVPLGLVILAALRPLRAHPQAPTERKPFDWTGAAVYALGLTALMIGLGTPATSRGALMLGCGIGLLVLFTWIETLAVAPVVPVRLLRDRPVFGWSNLAALLHYCATFGVAFGMSVYLRGARRFEAHEAGLLLMAQPVMMALLSPLAGRLSDRVDAGRLASAGMAVTAVALGLLSTLTSATPVWFLVAALGLLGSGFALFSAPNTNVVMSSVDPAAYGVASATVSTMRLVGQMLSMGIVTVALGATSAGQVMAHVEGERIVEAVRAVFVAGGLLCIPGIAASMARGRLPGPQPGKE